MADRREWSMGARVASGVIIFVLLGIIGWLLEALMVCLAIGAGLALLFLILPAVILEAVLALLSLLSLFDC